ncbi:MAG: ribonuclease III [Alphaproteobacteria bacterium RIFCSPHIGHO2_01_FULL_41_14]|nr:MAG: ribonuclease III [Alphaproteobacteria bacterium GWA1_45_9]OFW90018.1 MAG: ribonuclease III [Alphaproteobacteria bacterium RIFCSPHIGHO2_01_FULL_41_14]HCI49206.1 ribonuclease III [Holosporales bacterium]
MPHKKLSLNYTFQDAKLLKKALTHPSFPQKTRLDNYERCEFLGDRVLGLVIASYLYHRYPQNKEGDLSKRFTNLVRKEALLKVAQSLNLGDFIYMAENELVADGQKNESILADACEALIGAIYLDGGFDSAYRFILERWSPLLEEQSVEISVDAKTQLQELVQKHKKPLPQYSVMAITGPDHAPYFKVSLAVLDEPVVYGEGPSRRQAEQQAASEMLFLLKKKGFDD